MAAKFWLNAGKIVFQSGVPCLSDACPCDDTVSSPCNGSDRVGKALTMTVNWNGITKNIPLTWSVSSSSCFGGQGWEYNTPDVTICDSAFPTFKIRGVALCCSTTTWFMQIQTIMNGGAGDVTVDFATGAGISAFTIVSTAPMHITATLAGLDACGLGTDDLLIDIS